MFVLKDRKTIIYFDKRHNFASLTPLDITNVSCYKILLGKENLPTYKLQMPIICVKQ